MARYKKQKEILDTTQESVIIPSMVVTPEETVVVEELQSKVDEDVATTQDIKKATESIEESKIVIFSGAPTELSFEELYRLNQKSILESIPKKKKKLKNRNRPGSSIWNPIIIGEK